LDSLSDLNTSLLAGKVVVVSFEPPNVIVSVWNHMDCQFNIWVDSWQNFDFRCFNILLSKLIHEVDLECVSLLYVFFYILLPFIVFIESYCIHSVLGEIELSSLSIHNLVVRSHRGFCCILRYILAQSRIIGS